MRKRLAMVDGSYARDEVARRQTSDNPVLSNGAIIGIAVGGGAVLFGILIFIVVKLVKSNQKRRRKTFRKLDLADDDDDIGPDMGIVAPVEFRHGGGPPYPAYMSRAGAQGQQWGPEGGYHGPAGSQQQLAPPAPFAFHITGLRDSWPLVSWSKSPMLPLTENTEMSVLASSNTTKRSFSPTIPSTMERPTYPQLVHVKPGRYEVPPVAGQKRRSTHPVKNSVGSVKRPPVDRRSTPDTHLTSILRSTSQRLREAQRRPISRVMSVLSQVSGQPPAEKAPSPPKDQNTEERKGLVDDETEYAESVKSSVLNMFARTPSPAKMIPRSAGSVKIKTKSPSSFDDDEDSLVAEETPDLIIPAALTSPSKRGARSEQRHKMRISSNETAKIHEDSRTSMVAFGGRDIFAQGRTSGENDPFTSSSPTLPNLEAFSSKDNPLLIHKRISSFKKHATTSERPESLVLPLRSVSGNQRSPTKGAWGKRTASADSQQNPFLWSPEILKLDRSSTPTKQKRVGSTRRGHKRSQVVRVSDSQRPQSVSVVHEDVEDEPKSTEVPTVSVVHEEEEPDTPALPLSTQASSLRLQPPATDSPTSIYSKTFSTRPPSVATFEPFVPLPNSTDRKEKALNTPAQSSTRASYSATLSVYDYYSSPDENTNPENGDDVSELPSRSSSRSPSQKKARRRGRSFSLVSSTAVENSLTSFPPPLISPTPSLVLAPPSERASPSSSPKLTPMSFTKCGILNLPSTAPPVVSRLHGPRAPPRAVPRDSLQHSVGVLRRMNSEASAYSAAGSEGSPTLPMLRGGGISPQRNHNRNSMSCFVVGENSQQPTPTSSPTRHGEVREDRLRDIAEMERAQAAGRSLILSDELPTPDQDFYDAVTPHGEGESANALGLKMPVLSRPPSSVLGLPSPTLSPTRDDSRWSDVMAKPMMKSVARVSEMKMPSPRTPPKKGWEADLAAKDSENPGTRGSNGLYDERGFLKSSPERRYDSQGFLMSSPMHPGAIEGGMI